MEYRRQIAPCTYGRYFIDLHVFDLGTFKWQEIKPTAGCLWPSARSGFQLFVYQDDIYMYGGYSKEVSSDTAQKKVGCHLALVLVSLCVYIKSGLCYLVELLTWRLKVLG